MQDTLLRTGKGIEDAKDDCRFLGQSKIDCYVYIFETSGVLRHFGGNEVWLDNIL